MRRALIIVGGLLAGCAQQPVEPPEAPPIVNQVVCAAPAGMTAPEAVPLAPQGDYTQRDVALYLHELHRWGSRGWLRLAGVREHAGRCVQGADNEND